MAERTYGITGHMVVKNEDRWIWFTIMSVIDFVDLLLIDDTGSTDHTCEIIHSVMEDERYCNKVQFKEWGPVSKETFHQVRQEQIDRTKTEYFMVVDGDEIWYRDSLSELDRILNEKHPLLVATRFINCCGDVFHYRHDNRETYCINGITGSITLRVYSTKIPGIRCSGDYGVEGYIDANGKAVQDGGYDTAVMEGKYLHTSLLKRSSVWDGDYIVQYRRGKMLTDWDAAFDSDFSFPEVFYDVPRAAFVPDPFRKDVSILKSLYRGVRKIKRLVLHG